MQIRIRETGAIVQEYGFRMLHPNTSFSALTAETLDSFGADFVLQGTIPTPTRYQVVTEAGVKQIGGKWYTKYTLQNMTAEQIAAANEALKKSIIDATQARLDKAATDHGYDSILSLCTYATSQVPRFAAEGQYGVTLRDETWHTLVTIYAAVEAGGPVPTWEQVEAELPAIEWPATS